MTVACFAANFKPVTSPGDRAPSLQAGVLQTPGLLLPSHLPVQMGWQRGSEGGVLLAEPNLVSRDERERLCQLMFEVFNVTG